MISLPFLQMNDPSNRKVTCLKVQHCRIEHATLTVIQDQRFGLFRILGLYLTLCLTQS